MFCELGVASNKNSRQRQNAACGAPRGLPPRGGTGLLGGEGKGGREDGMEERGGRGGGGAGVPSSVMPSGCIQKSFFSTVYHHPHWKQCSPSSASFTYFTSRCSQTLCEVLPPRPWQEPTTPHLDSSNLLPEPPEFPLPPSHSFSEPEPSEVPACCLSAHTLERSFATLRRPPKFCTCVQGL